MRAQLIFRNDDSVQAEYVLDNIAASILDARRAHPLVSVTLSMPARDRAQAVALMRLALEVLDPTPPVSGTSVPIPEHTP